MSTPQAMPLAEALAVVHQYRADAVVITTMGAAREWQTLEPHPKDLVYMPSSMGQGRRSASALPSPSRINV